MPPKKKPRKAKKPVLQKQKQSQRVVVNINQEKAKPKRRARASAPRQPRQQIQLPPQQIVLTGGSSLPINFNPSPVQSSTGFNPPVPMPSLGSPIALPTFAEEPVRVIGDENVPVSIPVSRPVSVPTPVREPPPSLITEIKPDSRPPPPVISSISSGSSQSDSQFISVPTPKSSQTVSSLLSELSRDTGINSKSVADFLFKKKKSPPSKEPQMLSLINPDLLERAPSDQSLSSSSFASTPSFKPVPARIDNDPLFFTKEDLSVAGAPASLPTISTRPSFYEPSVKGGEFRNAPIIVEPKEVVVLKKPELKRSSPYDIFSDNEATKGTSLASSNMSVPETILTDTTKADYLFLDDRSIPAPESISSMSGFNPPSEKSSIKRKPPKKRVVVEDSDTEVELRFLPKDIAGRRLSPISETPKEEPKINRRTKLADLQSVAKGRDIPIRYPDGKKKTRDDLYGEIRVAQMGGA